MSKNDFAPEFTEAYTEKYGEKPPFGSDMGYNSFMLLAQTYDSNSNAWIKNMNKAKFKGADGELSFDESGLRMPNVYFGELQDGGVK